MHYRQEMLHTLKSHKVLSSSYSYLGSEKCVLTEGKHSNMYFPLKDYQPLIKMEFCISKSVENTGLILWTIIDYDSGMSKPHHAFQYPAVGWFSHTSSEMCVNI